MDIKLPINEAIHNLKIIIEALENCEKDEVPDPRRLSGIAHVLSQHSQALGNLGNYICNRILDSCMESLGQQDPTGENPLPVDFNVDDFLEELAKEREDGEET